ncbi:MAG: hypothetical protein C0524_18430 [Rhodobacter sp.]|nr:hypothetical protein [Rhodobacter sp.]
MSRRTALALAGAAIAPVALPTAAAAQGTVDANSMVLDGVLAYLGVLPAAIVRGHPRSHPEGAMHGGVPDGRHQYHLVLALFEADSGTRIETAQVSVNVMGLGHIGGTRLELDAMMIADTVSWGTFVELPGRDSYQLSFDVRLPDREKPMLFPFTYAHS